MMKILLLMTREHALLLQEGRQQKLDEMKCNEYFSQKKIKFYFKLILIEIDINYWKRNIF